jgi:hypothetical protein
MNTHITIQTGLASALLAATAAIGGLTAAPATALPPDASWDIGAYDDCIRKVDNDYVNGVINDRQWSANRRNCCLKSGGVWTGPPTGAGTYGGCGAPPANAENVGPIAPGGSEGVSDEPTESPLPTPTRRPAPPIGPTVGAEQ